MEHFVDKFESMIAKIIMDYEAEKELNGAIDFVEETLEFLDEELNALKSALAENTPTSDKQLAVW